ncbi:alpha/beta hydrolase [Cellulosilyticum ruminicola]|uniref:alpha/beta hydrolase n=1 Tax=Cellulosilyticum ruminicola TaxID=425254 RepID=UPI0006D1D83C|nr:alpha/beta hydrolase [Cellulosilyticum ruminicola]
MKNLNLQNVVGTLETATPITNQMLSEFFKLCSAPIEKITSNWLPPEGYTLEKVTINNVPIERLIPEKGKNGKVILMLHGGAYIWPLLDTNRNLAVLFSQLGNNAEVINVDYRIAPKYVYPAALEDCITAYTYLLDSGYTGDDILLTGESAGGGLVLALTLYLKDHNLPLPKGVIALSPWTEVNNTSLSHTLNAKNDIIIGKQEYPLAQQVYKTLYRANTDFKTPYLSPLYGDYSNFPNLLIQVGTYEMLYDDSQRVAEKAIAAGCSVTFSSYFGMCHCFQELLPNLPESKLAWEEIKTFIHTCYNFD